MRETRRTTIYRQPAGNSESRNPRAPYSTISPKKHTNANHIHQSHCYSNVSLRPKAKAAADSGDAFLKSPLANIGNPLIFEQLDNDSDN